MKTQEFILIGIDGGATKVSAWSIDRNPAVDQFSLGDKHSQKTYRDYPAYREEFIPVDITLQLKEMSSEIIPLARPEEVQGMAYMDACADAIMDIAKPFQDRMVLLGIGMPGLKTINKRGISALANGPRMPRYAAIVERRLEMAGIQMMAPIHHIGSDADYCGIGEEYAVEGSFAGVSNAYYIGGGTGVADALKLNGKLLLFDNTKSWLAKSWEMKNDQGIPIERYASAGGIQSIYSQYTGITLEALNKNEIYPDKILQRAIKGEAEAVNTYTDVSRYLALLIYERITTIYSGSHSLFTFVNPERPNLERNHSYLGTLLERIIIGQRLGDLLATSQATPFLWRSLIDNLTHLINDSTVLDMDSKSHYLDNAIFNPDLIVISRLREAPALGAGIDAYRTFSAINSKC